jgi:hypothetical protein
VTLRRLWASLSEPSRFEGDPYGGLTNQWGHYAFGVAVFILCACAWFAATGEMPLRWPLVALIVLAYAVCIEAITQGWDGTDSLEDTTFVAMGAITVAGSVEEIAWSGWQSVVVVNVLFLALSILAAAAACIFYAVRRF